jgi:hypothetical protein
MVGKTKSQAKSKKREEEYEVESIVAKRTGPKGVEYRIKWVGYPPSDNTWEPLENLENAHSAIESFEANRSPSSKHIESEPEEISTKPKIKYSYKKAKVKKEKESETESDAAEKPQKEKILRKKIEKTAIQNDSGDFESPNEKKKPIASPNKEKEQVQKRQQESSKKKTNEKEKGRSKKEESLNKKVLIENPTPVENQGSFTLKDQPKKIVHCSIEEQGVLFEIEWRKRKNGEKPGNTKFTSKELRKFDPDLIIDFYEERLSFVK